MPYICMARSDIPEGTLQILDLFPNSSQFVPAYTAGTGQTKYINRPSSTILGIRTDGTLASDYADGLAAYLLDNIEPGGLEIAGGTVTFAAVGIADVITLCGVAFTAQAGAPNPALQQFQTSAGAGSDQAAAVTLRSTINDAASVTAMKGVGVTYITAPTAPAAGVLALSARTGAAANLIGPGGNALTVVVSGPAGVATRLVRDATTTATGTLNRTHQQWTPTYQAATVAGLLARVDAGSAMTLAGINTALLATTGAELTTASGSNSVGTVAGVLECLSGRGYRIHRLNPTTGVAYQYMDVTNPSFESGVLGVGGFTSPGLVFGTRMINGEIKPLAIGGDTVNLENKGVRHTYDTSQFQTSLLHGMLNHLTGPTVLFPDSDAVPYFPWTMQHGTHYHQTQAARLVTVYDDDGSVLA